MNLNTDDQKNRQIDLIDGHVHISEIENPGKAIQNAVKAGITRIIAVSMDLASCREVLSFSEKFSEVLSAIGYHPWSIKAEDVEDTLIFITQNIHRCVALGEVGLDYKVKIKKKLQKAVFSKLLNLAVKSNKPVIIHSRFSYQTTYRMAVEAGVKTAVFHWYSGPVDILDKIIENGFFVSATPALAYSSYHQTAMARAPVERILIETDAPVRYEDQPSEPADLKKTLLHLSKIKKIPEDELSEIVTKNAERFFGL